MTNVAVQMIGYCIILVLLAIPLGNYIAKVINGERVFLSGILRPAERGIYRLLKIDENEDMDWKKYSVCTAVSACSACLCCGLSCASRNFSQ